MLVEVIKNSWEFHQRSALAKAETSADMLRETSLQSIGAIRSDIKGAQAKEQGPTRQSTVLDQFVHLFDARVIDTFDTVTCVQGQFQVSGAWLSFSD